MALINCPKCKELISDRSEACPKCLIPLSDEDRKAEFNAKQVNIKKLLLPIMSVVCCCLVLVFAYVAINAGRGGKELEVVGTDSSTSDTKSSITTTSATITSATTTTTTVQSPEITSVSEKVQVITENPDVRNVKWGMTIDEIKECETALLVEEYDTGLLYSDKLNEFPITIIYTLDEQGLYSLIYLFNQEYTNKNLYYNDYKKLLELYKMVYGEPIEEGEVWNNDLFKDSPEDIGTAISIGHLGCFAKWQSNNTDVGLLIVGNNYKIKLAAMYTLHGYEKAPDLSGI